MKFKFKQLSFFFLAVSAVTATLAFPTVASAQTRCHTSSALATASEDISPEERALLDTISMAEGTRTSGGYGILFGGGSFHDCSNHPRVRIPIPGNYTTAAGRYQFIDTTWDTVRVEENLPDFSPQSQDKGAIALIRKRDALADLQEGRFKMAVHKISIEWASLPKNNGSCPYPPQPCLSMTNLQNMYQRQLAIYQSQEPSYLYPLADDIFFERHPDREGQPIQPDELELSQEWENILRCEAIVDYKFYQRHPEVKGRKIGFDEIELQREWLDIYRQELGCLSAIPHQ